MLGWKKPFIQSANYRGHKRLIRIHKSLQIIRIQNSCSLITKRIRPFYFWHRFQANLPFSNISRCHLGTDASCFLDVVVNQLSVLDTNDQLPAVDAKRPYGKLRTVAPENPAQLRTIASM